MDLCNDEEKSNLTGETRMIKSDRLACIVKRTVSVYLCKRLLGVFTASRPHFPTHPDSPCQVTGLEKESY